MKRKLSIGSWAYIFNQEVPTNDFHVILHKLQDLGYDGVELGGFNPHPGPDTCDTREKRAKLRKEVADHGLKFSALAADLWSQKLLTVEDSGPYIAAFAKNLFFAEDLGIECAVTDLTRSDLYVCDEMFVCGTAAEVSAVNSVDDRAIPCPGEFTTAIAAEYAKVVRGQVDRYKDWVELVS